MSSKRLASERKVWASARAVGEYWIVDPETRSVELHCRNEAGDLVSVNSVRENDELTSAFLPGFRVRVDTLFV
jgi:Uma2 family endonuclease